MNCRPNMSPSPSTSETAEICQGNHRRMESAEAAFGALAQRESADRRKPRRAASPIRSRRRGGRCPDAAVGAHRFACAPAAEAGGCRQETG